MITYNSSVADTKREALLVDAKMERLYSKACKVYRNWIQRNTKEGVITLGKQTNLINGNKVLIWWVGHRNGKSNLLQGYYLIETRTIDGRTKYISVSTIDKYKGTYRKVVIDYTAHFCERLKERVGVSFLDWYLKDCERTYAVMRWPDHHYFNVYRNGAFCFGEFVGVDDTYRVFKTCINQSQEYSNQLDLHRQMLRESIDSNNKRAELFAQIPKIDYKTQRAGFNII